MLPEARHSLIQQELLESEIVSTPDLAHKLAVSIETIRRDLLALEKTGQLVRVHGGARRVQSKIAYEPPYQERNINQAVEKAAIGVAAAQLIQPHYTVILDIGTTAFQVAKSLPADFEGIVATNSLIIATELASRNVDVLMAPGMIRSGDLAVSGSFTREFFQQIHADIAFLGTGGLHAVTGCTDFYLEETAIKRTILEQSQRVYALVDSSKYQVTAHYQVCGLADLDGIVSDQAPSSDLAENLVACSTDIVLPGPTW